MHASLRNAATTLGGLPDVDVALEAAGVRGERFNLKMPLHIESREYGASELSLEGVVSTADPDLIDMAALFTGQKLAAGDLQAFMYLFLPPKEEGADNARGTFGASLRSLNRRLEAGRE